MSRPSRSKLLICVAWLLWSLCRCRQKATMRSPYSSGNKNSNGSLMSTVWSSEMSSILKGSRMSVNSKWPRETSPRLGDVMNEASLLQNITALPWALSGDCWAVERVYWPSSSAASTRSHLPEHFKVVCVKNKLKIWRKQTAFLNIIFENSDNNHLVSLFDCFVLLVNQ